MANRKSPSTLPTKKELLDALDRVDRRITRLYSLWDDDLTPNLRATLRRIQSPVFGLLMRARRR